MADYTPLSDDQVREIGSAYFRDRAARSVPQDHPTMVLVGGQPGAGKSAAAAMVRGELAGQGGYMHVDADRMREQIRVPSNVKPTSDQTQVDAGRLVRELRGHATEGRRNIVEEGTYRDPQGVARFVETNKAKGYNVELLAVATSREESLLGIYQRYELQHQAGADNPRFVPEKYHDEALAGFDNTVARVSFDRIRVTNRSGELLFDSLNNQGNALEALAEGRKLTDSKLAEIGKAWQAVGAAARNRAAPADYLESVAQNAQRIQGMQSERIHAHAMKALDKNAKVLASDRRYQQHTNQEIVKAAYFRGVHEKACEFKGSQPDFGKYDSTVASKSALNQLPDVADLADKAVERSRSKDNDGLSL